MLPKLIIETLNKVKQKDVNAAIKIETPDIVHTTNDLIDMLGQNTDRKDPPAVYIVRSDRMTAYKWSSNEWEHPQNLPIGKALEAVEASHNSFAVFIFWDIAPLLDDREGNPSVRGFIPQLFLSPKAIKKFLIFLEPLGTQYPSILTPYIFNTTEHYPTKRELLPMVKKQVVQSKVKMDGEKIENEIASALLGLTYTGGLQILQLALDKFKGEAEYQNKILDYLNREKEQTLSHTLGMNILKPSSEDIPYGMDFLMKDLEIHRHQICVEGQNREKGWLLIGTPGSGKSLLAKYLGYKLGYPSISFNISSIMNSLVGQTEKNMHNLCKVLETFAPCVLYIDEFEKALSGSGQELDGGTMTRALGILFTWLNDTNAPVFLLGSANKLEKSTGLALTRKGRFSQIYWVGEPCRQARHDICRAAFIRKKVMVKDEFIQRLADETCYFSGSDLVWLVNEAIVEAEHYKYGVSELKFETRLIEMVRENHRRVMQMKVEYDGLRGWALTYCKSAGLPPEK